jgi:hypothetical protein
MCEKTGFFKRRRLEKIVFFFFFCLAVEIRIFGDKHRRRGEANNREKVVGAGDGIRARDLWTKGVWPYVLQIMSLAP